MNNNTITFFSNIFHDKKNDIILDLIRLNLTFQL